MCVENSCIGDGRVLMYGMVKTVVILAAWLLPRSEPPTLVRQLWSMYSQESMIDWSER